MTDPAAGKPICSWCFREIGGKPVMASLDIDLPTLYFHNKNEVVLFSFSLFDTVLREEHERNRKKYEALARKSDHKGRSKRKATG
jgi:hypothetical protein